MSMHSLLEKIYQEVAQEKVRGQVASYIPELAKADLARLGLVLIDKDGKIYSYGDSNLKFSIQSISKPIALILALEDWGWDYLRARLGFNPSGRAFNSYGELEEAESLPANPMINSGAILTTCLIKGDRIARLLDFMEENIGHRPDYSRLVYRSERDTGDRNKAIAYLLRSKGLLGPDFLDGLDDYFKQCAIELDLVDLAKLYYPLAKRGINYSGQQVLDKNMVKEINALMTMAGLYNTSGDYALRVGLPSKSGVAGGLVGIVPGQCVIASYSPGLDQAGNSVLGQLIMEKISRELEYNIFY